MFSTTKALKVCVLFATLSFLFSNVLLAAPPPPPPSGGGGLPDYVPSNGLLGWWPFSGNADDESGNGRHGTVNGATLTADRNGNP